MGLDPGRGRLVVGVELWLLPLAWWSGRTAAVSAGAAALLVVAVAVPASLQTPARRAALAEPDVIAHASQSHSGTFAYADSAKPHAASCDGDADVSAGTNPHLAHTDAVAAQPETELAHADANDPAEQQADSVTYRQTEHTADADRDDIAPASSTDADDTDQATAVTDSCEAVSDSAEGVHAGDHQDQADTCADA